MSIFKSLSSRRSEAPKQPDWLRPADPGPKAPAAATPAASQPAPAEPARSLPDAPTRSVFADEPQDLAASPRDLGGGSMWDIVNDFGDMPRPPGTETDAPPRGATAFAEPAPADGAAAGPEPMVRRSGRVKTRLLGIDHSNGSLEEIGARSAAKGLRFPVGWIVVVDGPGRGHSFPLEPGVSQIGRGEDQTVSLDFGDSAISRHGHAMIAFDDEQRTFFLGHGGKSNLVRLNGKPVLSTEALRHGDRIRIGETTLMLVALCGPDFTWTDERRG